MFLFFEKVKSLHFFDVLIEKECIGTWASGKDLPPATAHELASNPKKVNHSFILETAFLKEEDHREAIAHTLHKRAFSCS